MLEKFTIEDIEGAINKKSLAIGLEKYNYIQENLYKVNVMQDKKFQSIFVDFYKINEAKHNGLTECIFYILETNKNNKYITIEEVIDMMYKATGNVQSSFASKVIATINTDKGVLDKYIRINLELPQKYGIINLDYTINQYYQLNSMLNKILNTNKAKEIIRMFDNKFKGNNLTDIKKLDLILWQLR